MKRNLLKVTTPALALGLALSAQADVSAASPNASVKGKANNQVNVERLNPVEARISSVDMELEWIANELENTETLSVEQYDYYQGKLISLNNRMNASTNQLNAISKKIEESTEEVVDAENTIGETLTDITEAQQLLHTIQVLPKEPEIEIPDEVEEGAEETTDEGEEGTEETTDEIEEVVTNE